MANPATQQQTRYCLAGGPAPGINSVIGAATIRAASRGIEVLGIQDGFRWLMRATSPRHAAHHRGHEPDSLPRRLAPRHLAREPDQGPEAHAQTTLATLQRLGVDKLITIGGDDTAFTRYKLAPASDGGLRVVHVPKTIDNDLDLPHDICTFGYQTARAIGVEIVHNLMVDAKTTSRWYFVVAMGRKAGHLALGIGKAAGATLTSSRGVPGGERAPEERSSTPSSARSSSASPTGGPTASRSSPKGSSRSVPESDLAELASVERDAHENVRIAEIKLRRRLQGARAPTPRRVGIKATIVSKNIGYEVRCADPIPFDMEYTRDLGYCAAKYIIEGGTARWSRSSEGASSRSHSTRIMDPVDRADARADGRHRLRPLQDRPRVHAPPQAERFRGPGRACQARRGGPHDTRRLPGAARSLVLQEVPSIAPAGLTIS